MMPYAISQGLKKIQKKISEKTEFDDDYYSNLYGRESVEYAQGQARRRGEAGGDDRYLPGEQNDYYKEAMENYRREARDAVTRRTKQGGGRGDFADVNIQAIVAREMMKRRPAASVSGSLLTSMNPEMSAPSLTARVLLG
jgi:hypothetical protein